MKKISKSVSRILSLSLLVSCFSCFAITGNAETTTTTINFVDKLGETETHTFNRVKISYHDNTETEVGFKYSANGTIYKDGGTKQIKADENEAIFDLGKNAPTEATSIQLIYDPQYGVPKVELFKSERLEKEIMTTTQKGKKITPTTAPTTEEDPSKEKDSDLPEDMLKQVRAAGDWYYDRLFDGNLNFNGDLDFENENPDEYKYAIGPGQTFDLYHDAVKDYTGATYSDGVTVLSMDFKRDVYLDNITMGISTDNYSSYTIYAAGADDKYRAVKTVTADDVEKLERKDHVVYPWDSFEHGKVDGHDGLATGEDGKWIPKNTAYRNVYLANDTINDTAQKIKIRFFDYGLGNSNPKTEYFALYELGVFEYVSQFATDYELYEGDTYELDEPVECQRIVGTLPKDMWYQGKNEDGNWVAFSDTSLAGYSAKNTEKIEAIRIQGFNKANVAAAKLSGTISFYSAPENLAKKAYEANHDNVIIENQATKLADFGGDPRAKYMFDESKPEDKAWLFDGDKQDGKDEIYNVFSAADKYRLTLKENSSITFALPKDSIIDQVNYYAGPQYTPKRYYVDVSDSKNFALKRTILDESYELADKGPNKEGHLSPFAADAAENAMFNPYYCAMREDQDVGGATGRYVRITNDGVLKTHGENDVDTLTKRSVILAKEVEIIGSELVAKVTIKSLEADCALSDNGTSASFTLNNKSDKETGEFSLWVAVYNKQGVLVCIKSLPKNESLASGASKTVPIDGLEIDEDSYVKAFVWTADNQNQEPLTQAINVTK